MRRTFILLQLLVCAGLAAQNVTAAKTMQEKKSGACVTKPSADDPSPCFMKGDDPLQAMPMAGNTTAAGYGYPANISSSNGWDAYGEVSYIYWYGKQEGLDVATSGHIYTDELWEPATQGGTVVFQDAKYTSGFKIGTGANLNIDDWAVDLVYTYLREETQTVSAPLVSLPGQVAAYNLSGWFQNNYYGGQAAAKNFTSNWKMHLDWLDLQFSRPYYQGRRLVVMPSAGLRASWIRQQLHIFSPNLFNTYEYPTPVVATSRNYSGSWAIGPRALVDMHWIVGGGFRLQGNVGGSLLFTQYTHVSHSESSLSDPAVTGGVQVNFLNYNCLRPMAEANLGAGWGMYFYQKKYHLDVSATYDFNYLWLQNMMRYLLGASGVFSTGAAAGDLVLHGFDLKVRFDY